jgi:hypothetical protein
MRKTRKITTPVPLAPPCSLSGTCDIEQLELSLTANFDLEVQINKKKQEAAAILDKNTRNNRKQDCKDLVA